ncbi:unnamed protein product [Cuscuta epithymum]|uniref:Uncharacterized protein n=1 Tax=Cuscuta epithymum TaxID=186058 RepID=A0AAV0CWV4_9ASTE|nr:unnamed protein product [Cuscuta epithymum]
MKRLIYGSATLIIFLVLPCLMASSLSRDFDFFYFVQQWPGAYCSQRSRSCCYPKSGKPAEDFSIHGLWPNYLSGKWPQNCDPQTSLDESQISDMMSAMEQEWPSLACPSSDGVRFWSHEWEKHGTCSGLNQHDYFQKALSFKTKANLLQHLNQAGIRPREGKDYSLEEIKAAIKEGVGFDPFIDCNVDSSGNHQLYQVYLCVDTSAQDFIDCPVFPHGGKCGSKIEFPSFSSSKSSHDEF